MKIFLRSEKAFYVVYILGMYENQAALRLYRRVKSLAVPVSNETIEQPNGPI